MTRLGRVQVYRQFVYLDRPDEWRWQYRAPNGRIIARCASSHERLRDLARSLELAFPGFRLLDQDCGLEGPDWYLHGMEFAYPNCAAEVAIPEDSVMGVGMRGVRIPVGTPVNLASRVRRG